MPMRQDHFQSGYDVINTKTAGGRDTWSVCKQSYDACNGEWGGQGGEKKRGVVP